MDEDQDRRGDRSPGRGVIRVPMFALDPQAPEAASALVHWLRTLENHFTIQDRPFTEIVKLAVMQAYVTHQVFRIIAR